MPKAVTHLKYIRRFLLLIGLVCVLCIGANAAPYTFTTMDANCQVDNNGTCRFSVTGVVNFHQSVTEFVIPLGQNVSNAEAEIYNTTVRKVNGVSALVFEREAGFDGEMNVTWHYTVRNTVSTSSDNQIFSVPLLAAQDGDVAGLTYTIQMPDTFTQNPVFTSGYYADGIDNYMDVSISEGTITAKVNQTLMAGDALTMSLTTEPGYFSMRNAAGRTVTVDTILLVLCFPLAVGFWIWKLRFGLPKLSVRSHPPTGAKAGVLRYIITADQPDLAQLCANWADAGYLAIRFTADRHVCLQQSMPMGNEREAYETKIFQALFSKGPKVYAGSRKYESVEQYAAKPVEHFWRQRLYKKQRARTWPLRLIGLLGGFAASLCAADTAISSFPLRLLPVILLTLLGGVLCWYVQRAALCCLRRSAKRELTGGILSALLLQIGAAIAGTGGVMLGAIILQILVGLMLALGVCRSINGVETLEQIWGLRRYLAKFKAKDAQELQGRASSYYYQMLPYAHVLGVGGKFTKAFAGITLEPCLWYTDEDKPYLRDPLQFYQSFRQCDRVMHREDQPGLLQRLQLRLQRMSARKKKTKRGNGRTQPTRHHRPSKRR